MQYQIIDVEYEDGFVEIARIIRDEIDFFIISPL